MEFHLSGIGFFTFFCLALVVSHASLPSEVYWQTVLPNSPMPAAINDLLQAGREGRTTFVVTEDGAKANGGHDGGIYIGQCKPPAPRKTSSTNDLNVANFFLEKDLHPGSNMKLHFTKITNGANFLPREVADSIPFSSTELPQILNRFSLKPKSIEAQIMKQTIEQCEGPGNVGEDKYCATSLESLIDFSTLELGKNVQALSSEVKTGTQYYKIGAGVVKMGGDKAVACHKQNYPYAVFYCHTFGKTRTYSVPLVDEKGTKSKAVAICHTDTSAWSPTYLAFQVLKVKPGTVPICHFLPNDHIIWVSN